MRYTTPNEQLAAQISSFGAVALDHQQVAKRLATLLPTRLQEISEGFEKEGFRPVAAMRKALTSKDYESLLQEWNDIASAYRECRIQYETHLMLYQARQSLRKLPKLRPNK
jgi:hypothetical protein